jgi:hypothetical protein
VARLYFQENFHKQIARASRAQERPALVATESQKMEIAPPVVAFELVPHRRKSIAPFAKTAKGAAPSSHHTGSNYSGGILSSRAALKKEFRRIPMRHPPQQLSHIACPGVGCSDAQNNRLANGTVMCATGQTPLLRPRYA